MRIALLAEKADEVFCREAVGRHHATIALHIMSKQKPSKAETVIN
jgi:hypothetical protein